MGYSLLLFSAAEASDLPPRPGPHNDSTWHEYFGTSAFADGAKYVGGFMDRKRHGQDTYTYSPASQWAEYKYVGECVKRNCIG